MDNQHLYELFQQVHRQIRRETMQTQEKNGLLLAPGQGRLLALLKREGGSSQKELADKLKIRPSSLSEVLKKMEKEGYLYKEQDKEDKRRNRYFLTKKGESVIEEIQAIRKNIGTEIFQELKDEDRDSLGKILEKLLKEV